MKDQQALAEHAIRRIADHHDATTEALLAVDVRQAIEQAVSALTEAAKPFRDAFNYDPGHSDLDNEQPIHVRVTLGDWRRLNMALRSSGDEERLA